MFAFGWEIFALETVMTVQRMDARNVIIILNPVPAQVIHACDNSDDG